MKMTITVAEIKQKVELVRSIDSSINDKLSHAIKRNGLKIDSALKAINEAYQEGLNDINIDHAATDDKGVLITDDKGNYQYKPDQAKKRLKAIRQATAEYDKKEVEIDFYFAQECPRLAELDEFIVEELTGILFAPVIHVDISASDQSSADKATEMVQEALDSVGVQASEINTKVVS